MLSPGLPDALEEEEGQAGHKDVEYHLNNKMQMVSLMKYDKLHYIDNLMASAQKMIIHQLIKEKRLLASWLKRNCNVGKFNGI